LFLDIISSRPEGRLSLDIILFATSDRLTSAADERLFGIAPSAAQNAQFVYRAYWSRFL